MFPWKTCGTPVSSSFSPVPCVQKMDESLRMLPTKPAQMIQCTAFVFFSTFEVLDLPIKGPMEDAGVTKVYETSPTLCLYVAPAANMADRAPLVSFFLAGNSTPTITCSASARIQASRMAVPTQQLLTEGGSAISTRLTCGWGVLLVASPAWVVWVLRRYSRGRSQRTKQARSVRLRSVGVARPTKPDSK